MGVVYRAFDREVGETVAIKALRPELGAIDPTLLERFKQELRLARRITHRNVVRTISARPTACTSSPWSTYAAPRSRR